MCPSVLLDHIRLRNDPPQLPIQMLDRRYEHRFGLVQPDPILDTTNRPDRPASTRIVSHSSYPNRSDSRPSRCSVHTGPHSSVRRYTIAGTPFLFELLPDASDLIVDKCRNGAGVRLAFADPECAHVAERDALEQMQGTLPGRIRNALSTLGPLAEAPSCRIGLHTTHLYNSVFRFDDLMIVTPYLVRARGYQHPALCLRKLSPYGMFASFEDQVEQIWETGTPYPKEAPDGLTA